MRRVAITAVLLLVSLLAFAAEVPADRIEEYRSYIEYLADDARDGRGLGTDGLEESAAWIAKKLEAAGLEPAFGASYLQPFDVKTGVTMIEGNALDGVSAEDWTPLGFSSSGEFDGELAFVGYGIEAEPIGYQELEGLDLDGKIVLAIRYEPQERDDASPFAGRRPSRWSSVRYKVHQARERGASAVIFVTGPVQDEEQDRIPALKNDGPESPAGIPVIQVRLSVAQKWLSGTGIDLAAFQSDVDRDLTPRSNATTGVNIKGSVALENSYVQTRNVVGVLPGRGEGADEYVVIGAHYDHLGFGGERSMKPNEEAVHNGADDNASGTAAVIVAAERVSELLAGSENHRSVVFGLFSAEEVGLAGSAHFVEDPPFSLENTIAMINLDMVGMLKDDELVALGAESAEEWKDPLMKVASELELTVSASGDGYGPSDQTSFYAAGIPVLHFFTGTHERYHTPEDDAEFINFKGGVRVAELTARMGSEIATKNLTPIYARASAAPAMEGDGRGYGAYLGSVPDYRSMGSTEGGVLLSDVRSGGPADLAGIKGGDTIVKMAGTVIENLYDMTFALQDSKPGDTIDVVVLREEERVTLRATLGDRKNRGGGKPAAAHGGPAAEKPAAGKPEVAKPAAAASPDPHAAPPTTHGGTAAGAEEEAVFELPEFYKNRPGAEFEVKAGTPFEKEFEGEKHLKDVRQLTFGGENAEAYFSPDGTKLIFQRTKGEGSCDQQYVMDLATGEMNLVSSGKGRTTCGYYDWPEADKIIYASTESGGEACPPKPDRSQGYVWPVYGSYELYLADPDGSNTVRLTENEAYDAEATWCHRGGKVIFTSDRDGDLDLYEMDEAGVVTRLTDKPGYDGGAFYSADCKSIVWRAHRPEGEVLADYKELLSNHLVRPSVMELFVMDADGSDQTQITTTGAANFGPYFHPDGNRIIYSSNHETGGKREFELFMIDRDGNNRERVTFANGFDGFPQFSPDGEWLVWGSNRAVEGGFETNLFIARWID